MDDNILNTVKKALGFEPDYTAFDLDITMHINTVFFMLKQLGVGPSTGFVLATGLETWKEFLGSDTDMQAVKTYVFLRVRLIFDPPSTSFVLESMNRTISDLEWRLNVEAENAAALLVPEVILDESGF